VGTLERSVIKRPGKVKAAVESTPLIETSNSSSGSEGSDPGARFIGTTYVGALRESLASDPAAARRTGERGVNLPVPSGNALSNDTKDSRLTRVEKLAERFRNKRRIVLSLQIRAADEPMKQSAQIAEMELTRRLRVAGPRGVELVPLPSLAKTTGWKRVLIDISLTQSGDAQPSGTMELTLRDVAYVKVPEPIGELPPPETNDQSRLGRDELSGVVIGNPYTQSGPFPTILEAAVTDVIRQLDLLAESHFDEGQRLAQEGNQELAAEEFVRFLFTTAEFDSPQAEEANGYVIASSGFSVLDWLWGEPEAALIESGVHRRRLPLGFRPAGGEAANGDLPRTIQCLRDGSEMILIPAGTEIMGTDSGLPDSRPAHRVTLSPYYIDKLETSVAQYERFIGATGHRVPQASDPRQRSQWSGRAAKKSAAAMPVVHVSWHDARAYTQWTGKSLPTEAQWERAARGGFEADYPRSVDSAFDRRVNGANPQGTKQTPNPGAGTIEKQSPEDSTELDQLVSVYGYSAALNPFGCQNMLGNVAEWCRDWYGAGWYATSNPQDPLGPESGDKRVVRGGSLQTPIDQLNCTSRDAEPATTRTATIGFRCVLNLPQPESVAQSP
jgi:formylglycine-generating enzyme required for sulfatase activity